MVIAIWKEKDHFQALSWKVTIHPSDTPGGECKYSIDFDRCSSTFPDPYNHDNITSYSVVGMYNFSSSKEQEKSFVGEMFDNSVAYHIITGSFDGSLKLWRSMDQEWELVGKIAAHVGPIMKINSTDCGRKIATLSNENTIYIWECVYLGGIGSFLLEDTINLDGGGVVVGFDWLTIGNGQLLLGVCLQNEVHVYTMRRCVSSEESKDGNENRNIWFCVAKRQTRPCIRDFVWGPKATGVIVHDDYFCLFSQWVLPNGGSDGFKVPEIIYDSDTHAFENLKLKDQQKYNNTNNTGIGVRSVLEIAENVGGSLPTYHPEALLVNIYSGNWKRAQSALSHLFQHLTNNKDLKTNPRIPQMSLSDYLEGLILKNSNSKAFKWSGDTYSNTSTWDPNSNDFSNSIDSSPKNSGLSGFTDSIEKLHDLSDIEKMQILAVIDLLDEISNSNTSSPYEGLDIPGRRFWVAVRFQQLYCVRRLGRPPSKGDLVINSSLIAWAFQSDCQESLFESLLNNDSSWDEMRTMGVGFWYTNQAQLRVKVLLQNTNPNLYIVTNYTICIFYKFG